MLQPVVQELQEPTTGRSVRVGSMDCTQFAEDGPSVIEVWSTEEDKALLEYINLHGYTNAWPTHPRNSCFWVTLSRFVNQRSNSTFHRTGISTVIDTLKVLTFHVYS